MSGFTRYKYSDDYGNNNLNHDRGDTEFGWWHEVKGTVRTKHAFVSVRAYRDKHTNSTRLEVMRDGYEYTKWISETYSDRYLVTLAKRFAEDVFTTGKENK